MINMSRSLFAVACRNSQFQRCVKQFLQCGRLSMTLGPDKPQHLSQDVRCFHVTPRQHCNEGSDTGRAKSKIKARKKAKMSQETGDKSLDQDITAAAVEAAQSLPGDWTKTADALMSRLAVHDGKESPKDADSTDQRGDEPLLANMQVGRGFEKRKVRTQRVMSPESRSDFPDDFAPSAQRRRVPVSRSPVIFTKVYSQPPLGIFDPKKFQVKEDDAEKEKDLWHEKDMEDIRKIKGSLPRNAFEEMIQWTKEGKMWTYPVDNEADIKDERSYAFHEHIFLERHLELFPSVGPLRRFMELVVLGLSKNPWLSVPEKIEHIQWFADYFREKQRLLEPSMGEQSRLKEVESGTDG